MKKIFIVLTVVTLFLSMSSFSFNSTLYESPDPPLCSVVADYAGTVAQNNGESYWVAYWDAYADCVETFYPAD